MAKIKVPSEIHIGGHRFKILLDRDIEDDGVRAIINWRTLEIRINPKKLETIKSEGLIHEFLHAIDTVYLNRRIDNEDIIEPLAEGLWQVLEQMGVEFDWSEVLEKK